MGKSKTSQYVRAVAVIGVMSALAAVCAGTFPMGLTVRIGMYIKLSPVFIIVGLVANLYGWWGAALVAFLGDFLQALIFGGFSPLISGVNLLCGVCFGLLLYRRNSIGRIVLSVLITEIVGGLGLKTLALTFQYGMPFSPMVYFRALQTLILIVVEIAALWFMLPVLDIPGKIQKIGNHM